MAARPAYRSLMAAVQARVSLEFWVKGKKKKQTEKALQDISPVTA